MNQNINLINGFNGNTEESTPVIGKSKSKSKPGNDQIEKLKSDMRKANCLNIKLTNDLRKANDKISTLEELMNVDTEIEETEDIICPDEAYYNYDDEQDI